MKININNTTKVQEILDTVQKRAKTRTLSATRVNNLARLAEQHLERFGVPLQYRQGCSSVYSEKVCCNSYGKPYADSTEVELKRGSQNWFLIACTRKSQRTSQGQRDHHFFITLGAFDCAKKRLLENIRVI